MTGALWECIPAPFGDISTLALACSNYCDTDYVGDREVNERDGDVVMEW